MTSHRQFDAHCHLFNIGYLARELPGMLDDLGWEIVDRHELLRTLLSEEGALVDAPSVCMTGMAAAPGAVGEGKAGGTAEKAVTPPPLPPLGSFADKRAYYRQVVAGLFETADEHFQSLRDAFVAGGFATEERFAAIALPMDIYYMLHEPGPGPTRAPDLAPLGQDEPTGPTALEHLENRGLIVRKEDYGIASALLPRRAPRQAGAVFLSPGYKRHLKQLIRLEKKHRGRVFPFIAVDPRRPGIEELVLRGTGLTNDDKPLVTPHGPFYGVKLYTRLGYSPTDPHLQRIFAHCAAHGLPVVVHGSPTGFPPDPRFCHPERANPKDWQEVLDTHSHPPLRVCFAHHGGSAPEWRDTISAYMDDPKYDVYADIACFASEGEMEGVVAWWGAKGRTERQRSRLLFGTDYDIMLLVSHGVGLDRYLAQARAAFGIGEPGAAVVDLDRLQSQNVKGYLGPAAAIQCGPLRHGRKPRALYRAFEGALALILAVVDSVLGSKPSPQAPGPALTA